jgi:diguanylate cyclase (GGDEF)-like protein
MMAAANGNKKLFPFLSRLFVFVWVCVFWEILFNSKAWSLDPAKRITQYQLDIWKFEWGLPQSPIYRILQSRDGYIRLGTREGLICFDGVQFRIFDTVRCAHIKNNYIRSVYEDHEGRLWFGSGGELVCLKEGQFTSYTIVGKEDSFSYHKVSSISGGQDGRLWVGTLGAGIFLLKNDRFTPFTTKDGLSHNEVYDILEDSGGGLWVATLKGLDLLKNDRFQRWPINRALMGVEVYRVYEDREENLWIGTEKGLLRQPLGAGEKGTFSTYTTREGLSHDAIVEIFMDRHGNLWVGTDGGGLNRMKDAAFSALTTRQGLSGDYVYSICEDREGSLWVGTASGGLNRLKDTNFTTYSTREGLTDDMVWCVTEDRNEGLWIGTPSGLNYLDVNKNELTVFSTDNGLWGNSICSIREDSRGNLWVGTSEGLNRLSKDRHADVFAAAAIAGDLKGTHVTCIFEDKTGKLWIGTVNGGLRFFRAGHWKTISAAGEFMSHKITALCEDDSGNLWIGTDGGGLNYFSNGTFGNYSTRDGLSDKCVLCLHAEKNGTLWIGTYYGGLNRFKGGNFFSFSRDGGFFNFEVHHIMEDGGGAFWLTSNKGIYRVKKKELNDFADGAIKTVQPVEYNETDGMRSRVCNGGHYPAGYKGRDGRLWVPTIQGVSVIDPHHLSRNTLPPPVVIEEIFVDNKSIKTFFELLPRKPVIFPPGTKNFEFHYTGLSFLCPQKVKFRYKLDGYDIEWNNVGNRRTAYYTNIPPGHYTFRVMACNNDGVWNNTGAVFHFRLKPYFSQTPWFYLLCALVLAVLIGAFFRMRIKNLKKRKSQLERLVEERTHLLEQANRELSRLATLDGMTGIYNYYWFSSYLDREWRRGVRNVTPIAIILVDVDFFKLFNDTYGHQAGDECLKKIASKLAGTCRRPGDAVARYGGEEFIVILPETDSTEAAIMAEKMREAVESMAISHEKSPVKPVVTISVGYAAAVPKQGVDPAHLIKTADEALYLSKKHGRNRSTGKGPE